MEICFQYAGASDFPPRIPCLRPPLGGASTSVLFTRPAASGRITPYELSHPMCRLATGRIRIYA